MTKNYFSIIKKFSSQKVLIIGESMLDVYLGGRATRICREAPVPIVDVDEVKLMPGGAANTAVNLGRLGAQVEFLSITGCDYESELLKQSLASHGLDSSLLLCDPDRKTLTKQRVLAGDHLLVRFDTGSTEPISKAYEGQVIDSLDKHFPDADAVVVSDYGYGMLSESIINKLAQLQKDYPTILLIDAKSLDKYKKVRPTAAKPNYQELLTLLSITNPAPQGFRAKQLEKHGRLLLEKTGAKYVAATIDVEGSLVFRRGHPVYRTFTKPVENSRAAGAGDTYSSALALSLAAGGGIELAADIAQAAAAVILSKSGTATVSQEELLKHTGSIEKQVDSIQRLKKLARRLREEGRRIVFTNGCFDILHSGHVNYLNHAKARGDILIVGLNSDQSVRRLKGKNRPINNLQERVRVLSGLHAVDYIVPFVEDTPIKLIEAIEPDVYVKGGDYDRSTLPEAPVVEALGGEVEIMSYIEGRSTTGLITRIKSIKR